LCGACLTAESPNPVTNGSFEELAANGFPADWGPVGRTVEVTDQAHSGGRALRFVREPGMPPQEETGLNRGWQPDSGEQGQMLAEIQGGITFWYQAVRSEKCQLTVQVIPMSARPYEDTGQPRAIFTVPEDHVGDGQWHQGKLKYDFSRDPKVRWVHVAVRLLGGPGEMRFDDVAYVERVGPLLNVRDLKLVEDEAQPGERGLVTATVENVGDADADQAAVRLELPEGLSADNATQTVAGLRVDEQQAVSWTVTGTRKGESRLRVTAGDASRTLRLAPALKLVSFLADRFLLAPGDATTFRAVFENRGQAVLTDWQAQLTTKLALTLKSQAQQTAPRLVPGGRAELAWRATAGDFQGASTVRLTAGGEGQQVQSQTTVLLTPALRAPAIHLAGNLWVRRSADRTLGELRIEGVTVARMPWLARVVYRNRHGEPVEVLAQAESVREFDHAVEVTSRVRDRDGGTWGFIFRTGDSSDTLTPFEVRVSCDQPRQVLAFEGPLLYVGEGTTGAAKTEAVFPCLEWLEGDEISSSTLDIEEGHPDQVRYVPHPNKVTIPFMGVALNSHQPSAVSRQPSEGPQSAIRNPQSARVCVGLLWDVHHCWDGQHDRMQPIFASPDRFEGRNCHLLGLMVPNVLTGLKENERLATEPYPLAAGQGLILKGHFYADANARDALSAMDAWFTTYGPDPVLPPPQGDTVKQVEFSTRAYLESLWRPEENAWLPFLGGPAIWRNPVHDPSFCYDLLMAAKITQDDQLAARCRERAEQQLPLSGGRARADDLGFGAGGVENTLLGLSLGAGSLLDTMGEDGAWRFDADRKDTGVFKGLDYHELGPDNAAELGTCARSAYEILRYARMSGDYEAYERAVQSLEFMRQFTVPRAAQVWEVPVHSPDILAAADAIDAYLEAYRFSHDERWLAEAKRWARAGLPFVYVWNDERFPWMRYGSIPVFGASWNKWSWFGVLVQWNGLRYAYALLKLFEYDPTLQYGRFTWKDLATGITHSAMYQQSTAGDNLALWPDSYNTMNGGRAAWDFAPRQILKNVYTLIGREEEPQTVILGPGGPRWDVANRPARVYVTTGAIIEEALWQGDVLDLALRYPPGESGYTLFVGLARPTRVMWEGKALEEREKLEEGEAPGWRFDGQYHFVTVRVPHDGPARIRVEGAQAAWRPLMARSVTAIDFDFDRGLDGWVATNHLTPLEVRDGVLVTTTLGGDPYLVRSRCRIEGDAVQTIMLRLRVTAGAGGQFYWTTEASPAFAEDKVAHFDIIADGNWHEYRIPVGDHPLWRGQTITAIRLDPGNGATGAEVGVDWMRGE